MSSAVWAAANAQRRSRLSREKTGIQRTRKTNPAASALQAPPRTTAPAFCATRLPSQSSQVCVQILPLDPRLSPAAQAQLPPLQVGGFLPRYIPSAPTSTERDDPARQPYGYLCTEKDVILSLDDVQRLLNVLAEELTLRGASSVYMPLTIGSLSIPGLSTPLLFSTQALDVSVPRVRNLIRAFLGTCSEPISRTSDARFREEARFVGPNEVAMTLRCVGFCSFPTLPYFDTSVGGWRASFAWSMAQKHMALWILMFIARGE
jgi:hypothetical protein